MAKTEKRKTVFGFWLALSSLIIVSLMSYRNLADLELINSDVENSYQVEDLINSLIYHIEEAESGQRGYLLTFESKNLLYLDQYNVATKKIEPELKQLKQLLSNDPARQQKITNLEPLIKAKLEELSQTIDLSEKQGIDTALNIVLSDRGKKLMDSIQKTTSEIKNYEHDLLRQRTLALISQEQRTLWILVIGRIIAFAIVCSAMYLLNDDLDRRVQLEAVLEETNRGLEEKVLDRTKKLEVASKYKDEFLITISHELRTPLTAIQGWIRLLQSKDFSPKEISEAYEIIDRNSKSLTRLIEDILDLSRIIKGKMRLVSQKVDLLTVINIAINNVIPAAESKKIHIQSSLDSSGSPVFGDSDRLQQIFWNILSNSIKFTPNGGLVQVRMERYGSNANIIISDNGVGIDPEFLPFVFERFLQSDSSTTRTHGGLGLGLAISKQLVELHGGTIKAESPGKGKGTTITVSLPLVSTNGSETKLQEKLDSKLEASQELAGTTILVVDDDPDSRGLFTTILQLSGAKVFETYSANEALQILQKEIPDILITDIGMPGNDGYWLMREIRGLPSYKGGKIPAIALTAYASADDRVRALSSGFQMHISKPVDDQDLVAAIRKLIA